MNPFKRKQKSEKEWQNATLYVIYLISFLSAFHVGLTIYMESAYLESVLTAANILNPEKFLGMLFTVSAILTMAIFIHISKILNKIGIFIFALLGIFVEITALLILAFMPENIPFLIAAFIIHLVVVNTVAFSNDLFIENFSSDDATGSIRGTLLTTGSIAFILSPFIAGLVLTDGEFWKLFFMSAVILAPNLILLIMKFHDHHDPHYTEVKMVAVLKEIWEKKDIYRIMASSFLLRFFYAWMVVYSPIYLHNAMGIAYSDIVGIIIPIAILPFLLFEYILGKIADEKLGEKEILIAGIIILAITTASITFIESSNVLVWAAVLFSTRIGASFVEIMTETYFFKKIGPDDAHLIGYFRNMRPLAYLISPLAATALLLVIDFKYLFLVLGVIMLYGLRYAITLNDTR